MVSSRRVRIPLIVSKSKGFPERVKLNIWDDMFVDDSGNLRSYLSLGRPCQFLIAPRAMVNGL